jgi:hypothetical protein
MVGFYGQLFRMVVVLVAAAGMSSVALAGTATGHSNGFGNMGRGIVPNRASGTVVYDDIQEVPLKNGGTGISSYIPSEGFECCSVSEFGDGLVLSQAGGTLKDITVVFDSWACYQGNGTDGSCSTPHGATFSQPITVSVYAVNTSCVSPGCPPGPLLVRIPFTKSIKYRPSANPRCDTPPPSGSPPSYGTVGGFIDHVSKECVFGIADAVTFNMSTPRTNNLPSEIVVTVAFNTTTWGYAPIGQNAPCFTAGNDPPGSDQCPYDSLNVSAAEAPPGSPPSYTMVGSFLDPGGVFVNFADSAFYCQTYSPTDILLLDGQCWTGYHPEIEVTTF